ncbi:MAG: type I 3-dehydroquinate dehydratase [Lachnospiraceae bacterium]|nr:type I 3-dehydroquinate dehydratase [Lachnospiraceae bacterium]
MPLIIKGKMIDHGAPMICVPVVHAKKADIIEAVDHLVDAGVEMIEWRADFYEALTNEEELRELLQILRNKTAEIVLLVTVRTDAEGGNAHLSEEERIALLESIAKTHCVDLVDVEYFTYQDPVALIHSLQMNGALVVTSHHNFEKTPSTEEMLQRLETMAEADADLVKLAVMPQKIKDLLDLLEVTEEFKFRNKEVPLITMSMGRIGMLSRISGEIFGSCVTFGADGIASAPGQLDHKDLQETLAVIHRYYEV